MTTNRRALLDLAAEWQRRAMTATDRARQAGDEHECLDAGLAAAYERAAADLCLLLGEPPGVDNPDL